MSFRVPGRCILSALLRARLVMLSSFHSLCYFTVGSSLYLLSRRQCKLFSRLFKEVGIFFKMLKYSCNWKKQNKQTKKTSSQESKMGRGRRERVELRKTGTHGCALKGWYEHQHTFLIESRLTVLVTVKEDEAFRRILGLVWFKYGNY